ncbi:hypothetical protein BJD55_gp036 [Gordonia phage Yvonnetastic]|uniref:Uncharacterized protein n=1 Tax=Gordonia phage Yvonnetastic TaxID=1821566 RepID=A0A142K9E7_9CAUD|nr:hypothetical protein BJD55_gp036 [Gordonia phage Yvonnetastic]AMS02730.1 hypothetical protein SEA_YVONNETASTIC_186 [Gordonia phage Yvonnetastic]
MTTNWLDPDDTHYCGPCGLYHYLGECTNPWLQENEDEEDW